MIDPSKRQVARVNILTWAGLTVVVGVVFFVWSWWPAHSLVLHAGTTTGRVTGKFPENHMDIEFTYVVGGREYSGMSFYDAVGKPFDRIEPGDPVTVHYDMTHPDVYTVDGPWFPRAQATGMMVFVCAAVPIVLMMLLHMLDILPPWWVFRSL